ncbi:MAG: hypothetical protein GX640_19190 [Fibrobacter sp.]|mgnify:CR=1 FL=1|nr:hypothetical protein [Fibrobacter sp.]
MDTKVSVVSFRLLPKSFSEYRKTVRQIRYSVNRGLLRKTIAKNTGAPDIELFFPADKLPFPPEFPGSTVVLRCDTVEVRPIPGFLVYYSGEFSI